MGLQSHKQREESSFSWRSQATVSTRSYLSATKHQGRMAISFLTAKTPLTPRAMVSALLRSSAFFANPESMTVPFNVSTLIDEPATSLSSKTVT